MNTTYKIKDIDANSRNCQNFVFIKPHIMAKIPPIGVKQKIAIRNPFFNFCSFLKHSATMRPKIYEIVNEAIYPAKDIKSTLYRTGDRCIAPEKKLPLDKGIGNRVRKTS